MISEKTFLKLFLNIIFFILKHLSERHGAASGNIYGLAFNFISSISIMASPAGSPSSRHSIGAIFN